MAESASISTTPVANAEHGFVRAIGLYDGTMIVAGSMIGSGIFIVAADITRHVGSAGGLLLTWVLTGVLTIAAALSYGELAALYPHAGGQYVYLREAFSPLWGFLYGWTLFLVIQTGTIAAVSIGFSRYLGVLFPAISPHTWIIPPLNFSSRFAISLSVQQFVAVLMIVLLTFVNTRGVQLGKWIQNIFTSAKVLSLIALIFVGIFVGRNAAAIADNFTHLWAIRVTQTFAPGLGFLKGLLPTTGAANGWYGLLLALALSQVGSLFSADAWNNIGFTAAEVKNPKRDVALSMVFGTVIVMTLYCLANLAYLCTLPLAQIQNAPDDRVATAALSAVFGAKGAAMMAVAIIISTFGCNNGLILAGSRVAYAMAKDGLFFTSTGKLNKHGVPGAALGYQCIWIVVLILLRTRKPDGSYGNLYSNLLDYVIFAALLFYVLTIVGIFVLRWKRPDAARPYRAFGYPLLPLLYIVAATGILGVLLLYQTQTAGWGMVIVLVGVPVYWLWHRRGGNLQKQE
jgi:APA family basic amino acid/polyamine antiporter